MWFLVDIPQIYASGVQDIQQIAQQDPVPQNSRQMHNPRRGQIHPMVPPDDIAPGKPLGALPPQLIAGEDRGSHRAQII